jgi:hypothetical protein
MYFDVLPIPGRNLKSKVPYGLTDSPSWLKYRAFKKTLSIRPFEPKDAKILLHRHQQRVLERRRLEDESGIEEIISSAHTMSAVAAVGAAGGDAGADTEERRPSVSAGGGTSSVDHSPALQRKRHKPALSPPLEARSAQKGGAEPAPVAVGAVGHGEGPTTTGELALPGSGPVEAPSTPVLRNGGKERTGSMGSNQGLLGRYGGSPGTFGGVVGGSGGRRSRANSESLFGPGGGPLSASAARRGRGLGLGLELGGVQGGSRGALGKPYDIEVPLYVRFSQLAERIADDLLVDVAHLTLYIVPMVADFDLEQLRREAKPVVPLLCGDHDISTMITKLKINNKPQMRYCIFYKILPYSLVHAETKTDLRKTTKFAEYLLADERVRYWRRMYLEHLQLKLIAAAAGAGDEERSASRGAATASPAPVLHHPPLKLEDFVPSSDGGEVFNGKRSREGSIASATDRNQKSPKTVHAANQATALIAGAAVAVKEATIVWPNAAQDPLDTLQYDTWDPRSVTTCTALTTPMHELTGLLRDAIGIPSNIDELLALKDAGGGNSDINRFASEFLAGDDLVQKHCCFEKSAVVSDQLDVLSSSSSNGGSGSGSGAANIICPPFPLLITSVREHIANEVVSADRPCSDMVACL